MTSISEDINTNDNSTLITLNILVTGGTGLVGSELINQLLQEGYHVKATYNKTPLKIAHENLSICKCNILDIDVLAEVMEDVQVVFHCAALVSFNEDDNEEIIAINLTGTINIVNAALEANVDKLVYVSSVAAIGRNNSGQLITEDFNSGNHITSSVYSTSKWWAEMEVWRGIGEGLDAIIVNPSIILGGSDWTKGSSKIFKTAWEEFPWYTDGVTGFVDVRDVAKAMILLWKNNVSNQRFILSAENMSYKDLFSGIAKCFGKKPPYRKVNSILTGIVWRLEAMKSFITKKEPLLNKHTSQTAMAKNYFDNSKVKNTLSGFSFRPISQTISDTCKVLSGVYHL